MPLILIFGFIKDKKKNLNIILIFYRYFDACAEINQKDGRVGSKLDLGDGLKPVDFKVNTFVLVREREYNIFHMNVG